MLSHRSGHPENDATPCYLDRIYLDNDIAPKIGTLAKPCYLNNELDNMVYAGYTMLSRLGPGPGPGPAAVGGHAGARGGRQPAPARGWAPSLDNMVYPGYTMLSKLIV